MDAALADGQDADVLARFLGEPAQGELDAGVEGVLAVARVLRLQVGHQRPQIPGGRLDSAAGHLARQKHQRAGVAVDRLHQIGDLLRRGARVVAAVSSRSASSPR